MPDSNPHLIIVHANGFDSAGWPLPCQILTCLTVADLYHESIEKPLIFTGGVGVPSFYRPNDPVLNHPVIQSEQTALMLENLGMSQTDIIKARFAQDTVGEGMELYALLTGQPDPADAEYNSQYEWMENYCGYPLIEWTDRAVSLQKNLKQPGVSLAVTYIAPHYQVNRAATISSHVLKMAKIAANQASIPVQISDEFFMPINRHASTKAFNDHCVRNIDAYYRDYAPIESFTDYFNAVRARHALYVMDAVPHHTNIDQANVSDHAQRPKNERYHTASGQTLSLQDIYRPR